MQGSLEAAQEGQGLGIPEVREGSPVVHPWVHSGPKWDPNDCHHFQGSTSNRANLSAELSMRGKADITRAAASRKSRYLQRTEVRKLEMFPSEHILYTSTAKHCTDTSHWWLMHLLTYSFKSSKSVPVEWLSLVRDIGWWQLVLLLSF